MFPLQNSLHRVFHQCLDVLFPPRCAGCQLTGHILCTSCRAAIQPLAPPLCYHCGGPLSTGEPCQSCRNHVLQLSGLRAASMYQEPLRAYIHALKYDGTTRLAEPLGDLLGHAYRVHGMQADMLVPVPLHSQRQRQRGYNHAALLAVACARRIGVPVRVDVLTRHRSTIPQVGLKPGERQHNVAGAFACTTVPATNLLTSCRIVVVDDVCTTGSTLEACAAPLFAAGAQSVWGLVLAVPVHRSLIKVDTRRR